MQDAAASEFVQYLGLVLPVSLDSFVDPLDLAFRDRHKGARARLRV